MKNLSVSLILATTLITSANAGSLSAKDEAFLRGGKAKQVASQTQKVSAIKVASSSRVLTKAEAKEVQGAGLNSMTVSTTKFVVNTFFPIKNTKKEVFNYVATAQVKNYIGSAIQKNIMPRYATPLKYVGLGGATIGGAAFSAITCVLTCFVAKVN